MDYSLQDQLSKSGLAVDIDETLSFTIGRMVGGMMEKFGNPENLTAEEIIKKYRYAQGVPYWRHQAADDWIREHNHSDEIQKELPLIDGAKESLEEIDKIIPVAAYITARPEAVLKGTEHWLRKHGFPLAPVICKPSGLAHQDNNQWKAQVLKELYPQIVGIIDDNPKLLDFLFPGYEGRVFLYDYQLDLGLDKVISCRNWSAAVESIRNIFNN